MSHQQVAKEMMNETSFTAENDSAGHSNHDIHRVVGRLKLYFALLSCLGGLVLASGTSADSITMIAIFFAVFGYVFVDWLELFALPPIAAYALMGLAALYCVSDFVELDSPGNHQMIAVAQLLVFVQAILMLQKKTRRIFEQLGVFCLLELIVAAVFNNAINYGVLLIPISVIGAWALSLLAALSASEGITSLGGLEEEEGAAFFRRRSRGDSGITISAPQSAQSLAKAALGLPRIALLTLAPAVTLVAAIFFYALPRTTDAARGTNRGNALVGFSDELRLDQIGQMQQSSATAMRVFLTEKSTGEPYLVDDGIYLRGRVLERYSSLSSSRTRTATWTASPSGSIDEMNVLPPVFIPPRATDENFYDPLEVRIHCESIRSSAVFTVAPYHREKPGPSLVHSPQRWTLSRPSQSDWIYPRLTYVFGTNAFSGGIQSDLLADDIQRQLAFAPPPSGKRVSMGEATRRRANRERDIENYMSELLEFDIDAMPTAARLAGRLSVNAVGRRDSNYQSAKRMEDFLADLGEFKYTLNLNSEQVPGLDPIEQFLSIDRRGHCQYFASALAMMLRSQGIPARIVVGYHTDEFNEFGNHYVARQLHAHAWVEALVHRDDLSLNRTVYGQPSTDHYWLRLDPTPGSSRIRDPSGGVGQVFDLAQNMWDDYVVDMDGDRQETSLLGRTGTNPMLGSYQRFVERLSDVVRSLREGDLRGGSLAGRNLFSWPAAVLAIGLAMATVVLMRLRPPAWLRRRLRRSDDASVARPKVNFYARTLDQLSRAGIDRQTDQTPDELANEATERLQHPLVPSVAQPLRSLTRSYYAVRFGDRPDPLADATTEVQTDHLERPGRIEDADRLSDTGRTVDAGRTVDTGRASDTGRTVDAGRTVDTGRAASDGEEIERALGELTRSIDLMTRDPQTEAPQS